MAERVKDELAEVIEVRKALHCLYIQVPASIVDDVKKRVEAAFTRLRSMPEEQRIVDYPHDITTRWLEHISGIKHSARATGKTSPIHNLTSVESILKWWEEEVRPGLILQHGEDKGDG